MTKWQTRLVLFINGIAYQSTLCLTFIHYSYYDAMRGSMGLSHVQLGIIGTITGVVSTIGFLTSGIVADTFNNTKKLLCLAYAVQVIMLVAYSTLPSWDILFFLQIVTAFSCITLYWGAMTKFIRSLGNVEQEGRLYGLFFASCGVGNTFIGLGAVYLISQLGPKAISYVFIFHACYLIFAILINVFLYKPKEVAAREEDRFNFSFIKYIVSMPLFWMVSFLFFAIYLSGTAMSYFSPLMTSNYGMPIFVGTMLATIRIHMARVILAPLGGYVIDKTGSSVKLMGCLLVVGFVAMLVILIFPRNIQYVGIGIAVFALLVFVYNMSVPTWFTPLTEIQIPDKMRGTAVGIYSALGYFSDAFFYSLGGFWLDKYGDQTGYTLIFSTIAVVLFLGIVVALIAWQALKKKKRLQGGAEAALAQ